MSKKEDKIKQGIQFYIEGENLPIVRDLINQVYCEHKWKSHGYGYMCNKCGYYSGLDRNLNERINKLIK